MYLMLKDKEVLYFDFEDCVTVVIHNEMLPLYLRSNIRDSAAVKDILHNVQEVKSYLSSRIMSLSKDNAKQIYSTFQIPQIDTVDNRVNICIKCKGVSIQDCYWVREDSEDIRWESVNIRQNQLRDIVDISLSGLYPTITTSYNCPELTTKGLFRKGWIRLGSDLYLLKSDRTNDYINTRMEILASEILDCFENKLTCIPYAGDMKVTKDGTEFVSICKNFVNEEHSFVEAWEIMEYCKRKEIDFCEYCLNQWGNLFACIAVLDYIIINTDRHTQNYGFFMNNKTGKLDCPAPLFDYNCALVADYFEREAADTLSQMLNTKETLRGLAHKFRPHTKIRFKAAKFAKLRKANPNLDHIFARVSARIEEMDIPLCQT